MQGNGSKFKFLKSCLHGDNLLTPLIILLTCFCNLKMVLLFESPPQKINPYFKWVWILYHKPLISLSSPSCYRSNYWLIICDPVWKLSSSLLLVTFLYRYKNYISLVDKFISSCFTFSHIRIHNENSCAGMLFGAVHKLDCHIIMFQSWTWW
jgi:hypothetical protein